MFGIGGEHDLTERELPHLHGWRDSAPVRIGNGAWNQRQLDVYGELLDAAYRLPEQLERVGPAPRRLFVDLADTAAARWNEPDQGIWEMRGEPRHFLYSKLMCWVALDRADRPRRRARCRGSGRAVEAQPARRSRMRSSTGLERDAGAFTQSFGSEDLDASNLMMAIVGFLPADDPRMLATINATAERLTDDRGLVYRYRGARRARRAKRARSCCARSGSPRHWPSPARSNVHVRRSSAAAAFVNDVGLLAEEVDAGTGELLGNFPQAFSHIGLVNAAWAISRGGGPSDRVP